MTRAATLMGLAQLAPRDLERAGQPVGIAMEIDEGQLARCGSPVEGAQIEAILARVPAKRQTFFFSATMPRPIQELIQKYARNPVQVSIEQKTMTVPTVERGLRLVDFWSMDTAGERPSI